MKASVTEALFITLAMGAAIFLCRLLPFLLIGRKKREDDDPDKNRKKEALVSFVEKTVPPVAMTVLAVNSIAAPVRENPLQWISICAAAAITALLYLLRRNPLISIFGGTAAFMVLERIII